MKVTDIRYIVFVSMLTCCMVVSARGCVDYEAWMALLPDSLLVARVTIPGSHDSATGEGWESSSVAAGAGEYSQAQELTVGQQLCAGVRGFDFRPEFRGSYLNCNHGPHGTLLTFEAAIDTLCAFLDGHPSEFLVVHLFRGNVVDSVDHEAYQHLMDELTHRPGVRRHLADFRPDLTVGEMRGRMLLLRRSQLGFCSFPVGGYLENWKEVLLSGGASTIISATDTTQCATLYVQDVSNTSLPGAVARKKQAMKDLVAISTGLAASADEPMWIMNFASGYTLSDGIYKGKNGRSDGYRDNAAIMNAHMIELLDRYTGPVGIVLADYVGCDRSAAHDRPGTAYATRGQELLQALIARNFQ